MKTKIITKVSTMEAVNLGKIEGLKLALKDARYFLAKGPEKEFFIKYLNMQIQNLQDGFDGSNTVRLIKS